jgi:hypothetical protein
VAEWFRSPPLYQQVDLEGLGSNPGAGKLDSGYQLSVKGVPTSAGPKIHFDHLEGGDAVDLTMARKISLCNFKMGDNAALIRYSNLY